MTRRYWDTNCFLGVLKKEPDKESACQAVIREAEAGKLQIVTSALAITEVLWPKGRVLELPPDQAEEVQSFFEHEWIAVVTVDRLIAERARDLVWNHKVRPQDAIHVATALDSNVEQFDTYDGDLISLSGKIGNPALIVGNPNLPGQLF